jgi:hypothetical protein
VTDFTVENTSDNNESPYAYAIQYKVEKVVSIYRSSKFLSKKLN